MIPVVYYVAASLDGYIATADGGIAWLKPFEGGPEDYGYSAFYGAVDALLLGRRTYEQCLAFPQWPYPGKACWVFSRRPLARAVAGVEPAREPRAALEEIARRGLRRAWLVGGGALAGAFQRAGLISEYIVSVVPVVLGAGVPLLGAGARAAPLELLETTRYPSGIVQLRYRGAAKP